MKRYIILLIFTATLLSACQAKPAGWRKMDLSVSPPASSGGAIVYDPQSDSALYLGGFLQETWLWKNGSWRQAHPANQPPPRAKFTMAYDETNDNIVVFGGAYGETLYGDTWVWDGGHWTKMEPAHKPPARCCSAMAYDPSLGKILLYGGWDSQTGEFLSDLWFWDGTDWAESTCCLMPLMSGHKMVSYPPEILSTFTAGQGTQIWDGNIWQKLDISSPPDRPDSALVYDSQRDWVILFGGIRDGVYLNDTWVYDGENWIELRFPAAPSTREAHVMFYDEKRDSIILFGGVDETGALGDTWELNLAEDLSSFSVVPTVQP
jgi:hypothetical protein